MAYSLTTYRWKAFRRTSPIAKIRGPVDVATLAKHVLDGEPQEIFLTFFLDTQHQVTGYTEVTRGILDASLVHPREVFRGAILHNAAAIVVVHNHPSGNPLPSAEDRAVTRALSEAGRIIGIRLLDHVVVGETTHYSFADEGAL